MKSRNITLPVVTSEDQAERLLKALVEKAQELPSLLPERATWLDLADQVAQALLAQTAGVPVTHDS
jgi:hypothetical protein